MPVSSNERTRVFPAAPGPHPALAVPQSSCSASGSADVSARLLPGALQPFDRLSGYRGDYLRLSSIANVRRTVYSVGFGPRGWRRSLAIRMVAEPTASWTRQPCPYMNQACIRRERKRLSLLRDPRLNETIFWIKVKESLSREPMCKIWLILLGFPRLASKLIPDTASDVCHVANARAFVSYPANYVTHFLI